MKFSFQKPEREFEKLLKHALKGEPRAQFLVGNFYHRGYGVEQDVDAAIRWYRRAAEQEYPGALCALGLCYEKGIGVEQDQTEAVKWCLRAAAYDYAPAQYTVGSFMVYGQPVS